MRNTEKGKVHLIVLGCLTIALLVGLLTFRSAPVKAHIMPAPCDFTTGGGFVITDSGNHANFGLVGGCKNGGYFGHVNFVDHDTSGFFAGLHMSSTSIDGYLSPPPDRTCAIFAEPRTPTCRHRITPASSFARGRKTMANQESAWIGLD